MALQATGTTYNFYKDPFFTALRQGSAPAPGPVAPPAGWKPFAAQEAQLKTNVNNFLIDSAYQSGAAALSGFGSSGYAPGSNAALLNSLTNFSATLSDAAFTLAGLGANVNKLA